LGNYDSARPGNSNCEAAVASSAPDSLGDLYASVPLGSIRDSLKFSDLIMFLKIVLTWFSDPIPVSSRTVEFVISVWLWKCQHRGQPRINTFHHPEKLLRDEDDEAP
jgi:hypothetical protein